MTIAELRAMRARLVSDAESIVTKAEVEARDLTEEESKEVEAALKRAKNLEGIIEARTRALGEGDQPESRGGDKPGENRSVQPSDPAKEKREDETADRDKLEADAFLAYCRHGLSGLTPEQRDVLNDGLRRDLTNAEKAELRTLVGGVPASGGYTIPTGFYNTLIEAQKQYNAIRRAPVTVLRTSTGAPLPMVTTDDTGNEGEIVGEAGDHTGGTDPAFAQSTLSAYMYSSKIVPISWELLQDSAFDLGSHLAKLLGIRLGRVSSRHFTVGTGTNQPQGVVTGAEAGITTEAVGAISYDDVVNFFESIDESYHGPGFVAMLHQDTRAMLAKIKDQNGRPLWTPAAQGLPPTIYNKPYIINNHMPKPTAGNVAIVAGDFSHYYIREVAGGTTVLRLQEKYAESGSVGFLAFARMDARLVDPGSGETASIKKLTVKA